MWHIDDGMGWWMLFWSLIELVIVAGVIVLVAIYLHSPRDDQSRDRHAGVS
jgi:hypothetical protein